MEWETERARIRVLGWAKEAGSSRVRKRVGRHQLDEGSRGKVGAHQGGTDHPREVADLLHGVRANHRKETNGDVQGVATEASALQAEMVDELADDLAGNHPKHEVHRLAVDKADDGAQQ